MNSITKLVDQLTAKGLIAEAETLRKLAAGLTAAPGFARLSKKLERLTEDVASAEERWGEYDGKDHEIAEDALHMIGEIVKDAQALIATAQLIGQNIHSKIPVKPTQPPINQRNE